jgi:hypothetical protein
MAPLPCDAYLLSDVIGDDPSTIGSGPTVPDPTTVADALRPFEWELEFTDAYRVLSEPAERARYDAVHERQRQARWKLADLSGTAEDDFDDAEQLRVTVIEVLYAKRRVEPNEPGVYQTELEKLTGCPHEHLEFAMWYLVQKKLLQRTDQSQFAITADGIDWLEERRRAAPRGRRLAAVNQ